MASNQDPLTLAMDILVVDDAIATLRMLSEILTKEGYKVRPIEEPQVALEAALAQPPSLILLDVKMPKMSGFELCRRLKLDERTRDIPVIFVSALDELQDRIQGFEAGGGDFISKPSQETEVLARVKTHWQLRNTQLHLEDLVAERTAELSKLLQERSEALSSAEEQIRSIFENSPLGIALTSFDGEYLTINQALLKMLRISEEELRQRNVTDFYADPSERAAYLAEVQESGSVQDFGVKLFRNDGSAFFASFNMSQLVLEGNDVLLTLVEDVTDDISAEQESAALEERERLARELHDSVSQTLFSAGMIADAMPRLWDKDQAMGQHDLEILSVLIRGASAEMRSLLLELRPDTLKDQTLSSLLETLAIAARARTQAAVSLKVEGDCQRQEDVILAFFRIAQETLNNIAKHAEAGQVVIDLSCDPKRLKLCIQDDGRGFDPQDIPGGHLGIGIMRERAQKIGAAIKIDSRPGDGTVVVVTWSEARGGE